MPVQRSDGRSWALPAATAVMLLISAAILLYLFLPRTVPNVAGQTLAQATVSLRAAGFRMSQAPEQRHDAAVQAGCVITQTPTAGEKRPFRSEVTLVVSLGARVVPDLAGQEAGQARAAIEKLGLTCEVKEPGEYHATIPRDHVIRQSPAPGVDASNGGTVSLTVSRGARLVPDVTERGREQAIAALVALDLGYSIKEPGEYNRRARGTVLRQWPPAGRDASGGAEVQLVLSRGQRPRPYLAQPGVTKPFVFHNKTRENIILYVWWYTEADGWHQGEWRFSPGESATLTNDSGEEIGMSAVVHWGKTPDGRKKWRNDQRDEVIDATGRPGAAVQWRYVP